MSYTEFRFTLPKGLVDSKGGINRSGIMRLATGKDEIYLQKEPRVRDNPEYAVLVILSRVITSLDNICSVTPELLEQLFLIDLVYLRDFYHQINQQDGVDFSVGES